MGGLWYKVRERSAFPEVQKPLFLKTLEMMHVFENEGVNDWIDWVGKGYFGCTTKQCLSPCMSKSF